MYFKHVTNLELNALFELYFLWVVCAAAWRGWRFILRWALHFFFFFGSQVYKLKTLTLSLSLFYLCCPIIKDKGQNKYHKDQPYMHECCTMEGKWICSLPFLRSKSHLLPTLLLLLISCLLSTRHNQSVSAEKTQLRLIALLCSAFNNKQVFN